MVERSPQASSDGGATNRDDRADQDSTEPSSTDALRNWLVELARAAAPRLRVRVGSRQCCAAVARAPQMSSSAGIARLVASLIDANLGSLDERRSAALLNFAMRILGSHMPAPPGGSQPMEVARRRLVREGRAADALALSEQLQRLQRSDHGLRRLEPLLQLLGALMLSPPPGAEAHGAAPSLLARAAAAPPPRLAPAPERVRAPEPQPAPARPCVRRAAAGAAGRGARQRRRRRGGRGGVGARGALRDAEHRRRPPQVGRRERRLSPADAARGAGDAAVVGRLSELGWMRRARNAARLPTRRSRHPPALPLRPQVSAARLCMCTLRGGCGGGPRAPGAAPRPS